MTKFKQNMVRQGYKYRLLLSNHQTALFELSRPFGVVGYEVWHQTQKIFTYREKANALKKYEELIQ